MKEKYLEDLQEIKAMMNRSSRVISLSGFSGIILGLIGFSGAWLVTETIFNGQYVLNDSVSSLSSALALRLLFIASLTLLMAGAAAIYLNRRTNPGTIPGFRDKGSQKLLTTLLIPLISGGILCLLLLVKGEILLLPGITLIFYGIALVAGDTYTYNNIRVLGLLEILLGLIAIGFEAYGILLWALGFGVLHIIYGIMVKTKTGS